MSTSQAKTRLSRIVSARSIAAPLARPLKLYNANAWYEFLSGKEEMRWQTAPTMDARRFTILMNYPRLGRENKKHQPLKKNVTGGERFEKFVLLSPFSFSFSVDIFIFLAPSLVCVRMRRRWKIRGGNESQCVIHQSDTYTPARPRSHSNCLKICYGLGTASARTIIRSELGCREPRFKYSNGETRHWIMERQDNESLHKERKQYLKFQFWVCIFIVNVEV